MNILHDSTQIPTGLFYTVSDIKALESRYEKEGGSMKALMEQAGEAAFKRILSCWPSSQSCLIWAGLGGNGGDAYVVAQQALAASWRTLVVSLDDPMRVGSPLCQLQAARYQEMGGEIRCFSTAKDLTFLEQPWDVQVDGLFGIGLTRPLGDVSVNAIEAIGRLRAAGTPVLSLDLPSGLHADTGQVLGCAVKADHTVTFLGVKPGLLMSEGRDRVGQWTLATLIHPTWKDEFSCKGEILSATIAREAFPERSRCLHKGSAGSVCVLGGDRGMAGAPLLSAMSALKVGAGWVQVHTHADQAVMANLRYPELLVEAVGSADALNLKQGSVHLVGPGLGQKDWGLDLMACWLSQRASASSPCVVDADGLNFLAQHPVFHTDWILTPHPAEAARLLQISVSEVESDRLHAAQALQLRFGGVVVLKGAGTVVTDGIRTALCPIGGPVLAKAGSGDVLAGMVAGILAAGVEPFLAACAGVWLHAEAGEQGRLVYGERSVLAHELIEQISVVLQRLAA